MLWEKETRCSSLMWPVIGGMNQQCFEKALFSIYSSLQKWDGK